MKMIRILFIMLALTAITGCVTKNPNYQPPPAAQGPDNPQYIPDNTKLAQAGAVAHGINDATAPVNPYAGLVNPAIDGVLGLAAIISALIARKKSNVASTLASGVVKAGPQAIAAVNDVAASTPHFADVAHAINEATP